MQPRRLIPYIICLVILAFALGSLSRSQPGSGPLLNSYWLLYLIDLGPVLILGVMAALIAYVALNWRYLSEAIGFGMAKRRQTRKRASRTSFILSLMLWFLALVLLTTRPGTIFNPENTTRTTVAKIVGDNGSTPNPFQTAGIIPTIANLIDNGWFSVALLGLAIVCGAVVIQSYRVSLRETRQAKLLTLKDQQAEGLQAVQDAIRLVQNAAMDPRSRIIACYQRLIKSMDRLGFPITPDMTARELDKALRTTFALKGEATTGLTQLFEEARYSLHDILDLDADKARDYLELIEAELHVEPVPELETDHG